MGQLYTGMKSTKRGHTREAFRHFRDAEVIDNLDAGFQFREKFFPFVSGSYTKTDLNSASSTFAAFSHHGGGARLDSGAGTIQHGPQIQFGTTTNPCVTAAAGRIICMSILLRMTTISTFPKMFVGLSTANAASLSAAGALNGTDMIGFACRGTDGHVDFCSKATTPGTTSKDDAWTLVDDGYVKFDMFINGLNSATAWVNGVKLDELSFKLATAAIPTAIMTPTFAFTNGGSVRSVMDIINWQIGVNDAVVYTA